MNEEIKKLLGEIQARPGMYIGKDSLSLLVAFLDGYTHAVQQNSKVYNENFPGFQEWIAAKYEIKSSHRWNDIILFYELDESKAFRKFFELLEEFYS